MKSRNVVGLIGASILTLVAVDASAGNTDKVARAAGVLAVGLGNEGRLEGEMRMRGPGFEQTDVTSLSVDGKQYVVMVTMQSFDEKSGYGPWQCTCSSYEMQQNAAPKEIAHLVHLTNYKGGGERLCNHPSMATDGNAIVWSYGSDYNNNRPNTYVGAIDHQCRTLAEPIMVNAKTTDGLPGITATDNGAPTTTLNNNDGAPKVVYNGNGNFTVGYLSTAGNATEAAYALGINLSKVDVLYNLKRTWIMPIVTPSNIGRPTIAPISADRSLFCASKGNNRPAEVGIECAVLNSNTGEAIWKNVVAPSYRDSDKMGGMMHYMGQPSLAKLADGSYALNGVESNGMGKNTNLKGTNLGHLFTLDYAADAMVINGHITGVAAHQTHSAICAGGYGVEGKTHVGVISAAPTGIGRPAMVFVDYDSPTKSFTFQDKVWPIGYYGDSGHLANWYGRNPMRQGRDFLRCIGDVPNAGYHQEGGYMKDVETFFVAAVSGRVPGDYKNSLFLSFIPGKADTISAPQNPVPADEVPPPATDNTGNQTNPAPASTSGCACSTPGTSTDSGTMLGGLALVGLVLGATRRKKHAKA